MRSLVCIPCLYNGETCLKAFRSVIGESDLLILSNGGDDSVKQAITLFRTENHPHKVYLIENEVNQYVTAAWNNFLDHFLDYSWYDQLVIMNSDLILEPGWSSYLVDGMSCVPTDGSHETDEVVTVGTAGVFLHLNKEMAKIVYPIPSEIRIWFNDLWAYTRIRNAGYKTVVRAGLKAVHYQNGSQTCKRLPEFQEIIEQDKIAWLEIEKTL